MLFRSLLSALFIITFFQGHAQPSMTVKRDLAQDWLVFENQYRPFSPGETVQSISFNLIPSFNQWLKIESEESFYLFANGKIINKYDRSLLIRTDSLLPVASTSGVLVTLYQNQIDRNKLQTLLFERTPNNSVVEKPSGSLRDFASAVGLGLAIFLVVLLQTQPKLASDYFSPNKTLLVREGDESESGSRIALSSNIWFYIFISLVVGYFLHIVGEFMYPPATVVSFWGRVVLWLTTSATVLALLFLKVVLVWTMATLFGFGAAAPVHFFTTLRILLIASSVLAVVGFVYLISRGQNPFVFRLLSHLLVGAFIVWMVVAFLKLNRKVEHSVFHLFSYICATELIPLLLTIKVLYH